jgi:hypothetical protein
MRGVFEVFGICLLTAGCATPVTPLSRYALPRPSKTQFFESIFAGQAWRQDGAASATFVGKIEPPAPEVMYVEAALPNAEAPERPFITRKRILKSEETVRFTGPKDYGWKPGTYYKFTLRVYSDPDYSHLIGTHEQEELCTEPQPGWAR